MWVAPKAPARVAWSLCTSNRPPTAPGSPSARLIVEELALPVAGGGNVLSTDDGGGGAVPHVIVVQGRGGGDPAISGGAALPSWLRSIAFKVTRQLPSDSPFSMKSLMVPPMVPGLTRGTSCHCMLHLHGD